MTIRALPQVVFLLAVFLLTSITGCQNYDTLVTKDQAAETAWADVEAQLQRRMDLVPNLVATVKASAKHEEQTLKEVADARASATSIKLSADDLSDPAKVAAFEKAQDNLKGSLSRLMMVNEQYPDLKANAAFHDLQVQLEGTENRILRAREQYNAAVGDYNTELGKIRGQAVNKITGKPFKPRVRFQAAAGAEKVPTVDFGK
jgi:LemA protein